MQQLYKKIYYTFITLLVVLPILIVSPANQVEAYVGEPSVRLTRLNEATATDMVIYVVLENGLSATGTIDVTLPTSVMSFGGSYDFNDMSLEVGDSNDCNTASFSAETLGASASGATWGATVVSDVASFESGSDTITADRCVRMTLFDNGGTHALTNPTVGSNTSYWLEIQTTDNDYAAAAFIILDDAGTPDGDQIQIDTEVSGALTFDIDVASTDCDNSTETTTSANAVDFGILPPNSVVSSSTDINFVCIDVASNSTSGVRVYVQSLYNGANGALENASLDTIDSATADLTSGAVTSGYGIRISSIGTPSIGSFTVQSPFDSVTAGSVGLIPGLTSAPAPLVAATGVVSTGAASRIAAELSVKINTGTNQGVYTDTLNFTASVNL